MPPKSRGPDTPSPAKKRKTEVTPVKRGVDFFFRKQEEKVKTRSANEETVALFVQSDGEDGDERDVKKRRQEEEDEKFARELQEIEGRREIDDEQFAQRLAKDYEMADNYEYGINGDTETHVKSEDLKDDDDLYGHEVAPQQPFTETRASNVKNKPSSEHVSPSKLTLDNPTSTSTTLEEIYSIPLDKDPLIFSPATDASIASTWLSSSGTPYAFLTHSFILINSTRSRLKIVDYLVNTLRVIIHHDPTSLLPLVWLTTNAIAPPFEGVELNLGGSVISKALVSASGLTSATLKTLYDKWGDVGDVAFEAKMAVRTLMKPTPLTVRGVYTTLRSIARAKGQGSAETKRRLVERLLVSAKGEEVRYIGRTLVQHVSPRFPPFKAEANGSYVLERSRRQC